MIAITAKATWGPKSVDSISTASVPAVRAEKVAMKAVIEFPLVLHDEG
jgi:hypothetical protein